ncbi:MAG: pyruvate, phosphate dikinase [Nanoarchaeota archaeon]|nr:pyruvate, phosphate dikinase [Nanoarchaeota archaeon]
MGRQILHFREGNRSLVDLIGGKGAALSEMIHIGLPVPSGFTITTDAYADFFRWTEDTPMRRAEKKFFGKDIFAEYEKCELMQNIAAALKMFEQETGKGFGIPENPLLVSVRSGASVSMPGMLETILNVGLNDRTIKALEAAAGKQFAEECYERLRQMFNSTTGHALPQDPFEQMTKAVEAVFRSARGEKAIAYKQIQGLPMDLGTAVNIQQMVFGNLNKDSCTGVVFTRNPATGERELYGEYLPQAQGEELVSGIRTPEPISCMKSRMPAVYDELSAIAGRLEAYYRDMQDIEFTVENSRLYILQTRAGKRAAQAAVKIAVDMAKEGLIGKHDAVLRVKPEQLLSIHAERIDPSQRYRAIARGTPTGPGIAVGKIALTSESALELNLKGERVVLVRKETSTEDIRGIHASDGILTAAGGALSHAAVVARSLDKCCITGCSDLRISKDSVAIKDHTFTEGSYISLDGATGEVIGGRVRTVRGEVCSEVRELTAWIGEMQSKKTAAFIASPDEILEAEKFGTETFYYQTEHHFFLEERLGMARDFLLSTEAAVKRDALKGLSRRFAEDYQMLFGALKGRQVVVRLLSETKGLLPSEEEMVLQDEMDVIKDQAQNPHYAKYDIQLGMRIEGVGVYGTRNLKGVLGIITNTCNNKFIVEFDEEVTSGNCCGKAKEGRGLCLAKDWLYQFTKVYTGEKKQEPIKQRGMDERLAKLRNYTESPKVLQAIHINQVRAIAKAAASVHGTHVIIEVPRSKWLGSLEKAAQREFEYDGRHGSAIKFSEGEAYAVFTPGNGYHPITAKAEGGR